MDGTKAKLETLRGRLEPMAKAADVLAVARELETLAGELSREEAAAATGTFAWPRDMNEAGGDHAWGVDPDAERRDG